MLITKIRTRILPLSSLALAFWLGACSSDQEQAEEPVANEEGESQNNENNGNSGNAMAQGENQGETTEDASGSSEGEGNATAANESSPPAEGAPPAEQSVPPPVAAAPEPPPAAAAAPAAAPPPAQGVAPIPNRTVRYVQVASATVHSEPNESSAAVVSLVKGDHILVSEENGWGKIADGKYIKLSDLSTKGVPRDRSPLAWN